MIHSLHAWHRLAVLLCLAVLGSAAERGSRRRLRQLEEMELTTRALHQRSLDRWRARLGAESFADLQERLRLGRVPGAAGTTVTMASDGDRP